MFEAWIAFIEAITISDWVVIFLVTKPIFVVCTFIAWIWSRRGRVDQTALPGPKSTPLLDSEYSGSRR